MTIFYSIFIPMYHHSTPPIFIPMYHSTPSNLSHLSLIEQLIFVWIMMVVTSVCTTFVDYKLDTESFKLVEFCRYWCHYFKYPIIIFAFVLFVLIPFMVEFDFTDDEIIFMCLIMSILSFISFVKMYFNNL